MEENNFLTFLYNRVKADEDDKYEIYVYEFSSVGVCRSAEDNSCLEHNGEDYYYINDASHMNDALVFAFPYKLSSDELENIDEVVSTFADTIDMLSEGLFYQVYEKGSNEVKTYYLDSSENVYSYEIDMSNINGINDIFDENKRKVSEVSTTLKKAFKDAKREDMNLSVNDIFEKIRKVVMCQDEQIKAIISNIKKNIMIKEPSLKSNLFICGNPGVGKTEIFRNLQDSLDVPVVIKNITTMNDTAEKCASEILYNLYVKANGDISKVERGIVVIDGIDEQIKNDNTSKSTNLYLDEIIKASKGLKFSFNAEENSFEIDTTFITFVFISNYLKKIGYSYDENSFYESNVSNADKSLMRCGLSSKFSRDCNVISMNSLNIEDLCKIINESEKSVFLLYKYMFEEMGINLLYDESCIEAIAKKAQEFGIGVHSVKAIIEKAFEIILYNIYSSEGYSEVVIEPELFDDNMKFVLK